MIAVYLRKIPAIIRVSHLEKNLNEWKNMGQRIMHPNILEGYQQLLFPSLTLIPNFIRISFPVSVI